MRMKANAPVNVELRQKSVLLAIFIHFMVPNTIKLLSFRTCVLQNFSFFCFHFINRCTKSFFVHWLLFLLIKPQIFITDFPESVNNFLLDFIIKVFVHIIFIRSNFLQYLVYDSLGGSDTLLPEVWWHIDQPHLVADGTPDCRQLLFWSRLQAALLHHLQCWYVGQDEGSGQDKEPDQAEIFTCVAHFSSFTLNHNVTGDRSQPLEHE